jgi:hypothetical protein
MTPKRLVLVFGLMSCLAGAAYLAREAEGPGLRMTGAAEKFVASLTKEQKAKAVFGFDDKERTNWYFTPQQRGRKPLRKGLPLEDMTADQKKLALELVKAGTSESGHKQATTIMSLESILAELEKKRKGGIVRDPEWYFFAVFGAPSRRDKWGWRVEGHHLSLNFTVEAGKVLSATPFFMGANPAVVKAGPRKGLETLPEAEDQARKLFASLDKDQRKVAHRPKAFPEIEEAVAKPGVGPPVGLPATKMSAAQRDTLWKLIEGYAGRMPPDVAAHELGEVKKAGLDKVHFAFGPGDGTPGTPHTYRVQGPTFVIEFLNVQSDSAGNPANHIHSAWRSLPADFGLAGR